MPIKQHIDISRKRKEIIATRLDTMQSTEIDLPFGEPEWEMSSDFTKYWFIDSGGGHWSPSQLCLADTPPETLKRIRNLAQRALKELPNSEQMLSSYVFRETP